VEGALREPVVSENDLKHNVSHNCLCQPASAKRQQSYYSATSDMMLKTPICLILHSYLFDFALMASRSPACSQPQTGILTVIINCKHNRDALI
jgi:hypothetical protein